ncbi:MAG: endolytic transglycosylase MltG [Acidimicrobiia bacterium]|nr:endolytic transglycosylase MltG [Acidimicrobiia bacterium]MBV8983651.1 endolytic transglycosylase MltG [Acidimicrobiia bacterium]
MTQPSRPLRPPGDDVYVRDAYHYEELPKPLPKPRRGPRAGRILLIVLGVIVLLLALAGFWVQRQISGHPHGGPVAVSIPKGSSTSAIGSLLHRHGVIGNTTVWRLYTTVKRPGPLQSGDYQFRHDENMGHVLDVLHGGTDTAVHRVTIPEGLTLREIAARVGAIPGLSADRFMAIAQSGTIHSQFQPPGSTSLEGLVFADTYFVQKGDDETKLLAKMVDNFDRQASAVGMQDAPAKAGVSTYDAIIVASLVEREAKVDEDRGMIARTIYNRLSKNMKLGIDATVEYSIGTHKPTLSNADLDTDSPYNTRKYPGLPPTPIAAVGQKSLMAALNPTPGPWLYYVLADPSGKHAFATTDAEFEQLVRQARAKGLI